MQVERARDVQGDWVTAFPDTGSSPAHPSERPSHGSACLSWNMRSDPQSQLSVVPWSPLVSLRGFLEEAILQTVAGPRFYASVSLS